MTEPLTPLQRLTALYTAGGYGRLSAQFAADLLAEHTAGKDTPTPGGASTLGSDVLDLLAAIRDAVDVPLPSLDPADERAYHQLMYQRLTDLHVSLSVALAAKSTDTLDAADEAAYVRARTACSPVTYALWECPAAGGEQA
jgi:hypothetical protein